MRPVIIAIIIIVIIIVGYVLSTWNTSTYDDYLYGFWVADGDEFCEESEIESMMIFVGEPDCGWTSRSRTCYIIIMNDLCNQGFTLKYRTGWSGPGVGKYCICADVEFDDEQIWPEQVYIDVDMRNGTMKVHADDVVYAKLVKQNDTSNLARECEDVELVDE